MELFFYLIVAKELNLTVEIFLKELINILV